VEAQRRARRHAAEVVAQEQAAVAAVAKAGQTAAAGRAAEKQKQSAARRPHADGCITDFEFEAARAKMATTVQRPQQLRRTTSPGAESWVCGRWMVRRSFLGC
jgi:hypothetical protein